MSRLYFRSEYYEMPRTLQPIVITTIPLSHGFRYHPTGVVTICGYFQTQENCLEAKMLSLSLQVWRFRMHKEHVSSSSRALCTLTRMYDMLVILLGVPLVFKCTLQFGTLNSLAVFALKHSSVRPYIRKKLSFVLFVKITTISLTRWNLEIHLT